MIQGRRAQPLAPGYLLPRLRRWLSDPIGRHYDIYAELCFDEPSFHIE